MVEIKDMPFSGIKCDEKTNTCKVWWVQTIPRGVEGLEESRTITIEVKTPFPHTKATGKEEERYFETLLRDSIADIEGVEV